MLASAYGSLRTGVIPAGDAKLKIGCILWCRSSIDDNEEDGKSCEGMENHYALEILDVDDIVRGQVV